MTPVEMGRKGGKARAVNLSPRQRSRAARLAALARWRKNGSGGRAGKR